MRGVEDRKDQIMEKPVPGCLGRVVNLFDLGNGVAGNRLLADTPHREVSSLSRSRSDVAMMSSAPFGDHIENKMIVSEFKRSLGNTKSNGTPMKTLIAREMSKEVESTHNPPSLVAKLMGLDTLPHQPSNVHSQRSHSKGYSRRSLSHSDILVDGWVQDRSFLDKQMQHEVHHCDDQGDYKDVFEIQLPTQKVKSRENSPHKGRFDGNLNEMKMTLVRQKFMEAKRLATDEKGRQSKEFQDALEVLSSNKELFLKLLQEPNSLIPQHLCGFRFTAPTHETKRITVLKTSKVAEDDNFEACGKKSDRQMKKLAQMTQATRWNKSKPEITPIFDSRRVDESHAQPTRIVVLKPTSGNAHNIDAFVSPPCSSPRTLHSYGAHDDDEAQEPREVAREITRQMRDSLMGHRRDETLLSSVFSNGYIGDDSSFNQSDNDYANYATGVVSDSEIVSPTSKHSWDYINRFGSPFSSSSFSRASCSPESSVCREAKKRLSERWAMMTSNGVSHGQTNARTSSSTLGEMLALSDTKKQVRSEDEAPNKELEARGSTSCLINDLNKEENMIDLPKSLLRSKSLPVLSTVHIAGLNTQVFGTDTGKMEVPKEQKGSKSTKSSFTGKVASLFFSRNKKSNKDKVATSEFPNKSESSTVEVPGSPVSVIGKVCDDTSQCPHSSSSHVDCSPPNQRPCGKPTPPESIGLGTEQSILSSEGELLVAKPPIPGNATESQDQPSPISVLEDPFKEDDSTPEPSGSTKVDHHGNQGLHKSNLIDKSPLIGSIARTLSWEDTSIPYPLKCSIVCSVAEDEEDWLSSVQMLLSAAALGSKVLSDLPTVGWYSKESPLDPSLREKYVNLNDKDFMNETTRRQRRSYQKLVFDCVNAVLVEITGYGPNRSTFTMASPPSGQENKDMEGSPSSTLGDMVWARLKDSFFGEVSCTFGDGGDMNSLVLERVVRNEVVGKSWSDNFRTQFESIGVEIEGKLLEDLVEEAVVDLASWV